MTTPRRSRPLVLRALSVNHVAGPHYRIAGVHFDGNRLARKPIFRNAGMEAVGLGCG
jgi:hypothetical protein